MRGARGGQHDRRWRARSQAYLLSYSRIRDAKKLFWRRPGTSGGNVDPSMTLLIFGAPATALDAICFNQALNEYRVLHSDCQCIGAGQSSTARRRLWM